MSNILYIPPIEIEISLDILGDDMPEALDMDGNAIIDRVGETAMIFQPAALTTWRELRNFVSQHIAPYIVDNLKGKVQVNIPGVRDEGAMDKPFMLVINYNTDPNRVLS